MAWMEKSRTRIQEPRPGELFSAGSAPPRETRQRFSAALDARIATYRGGDAYLGVVTMNRATEPASSRRVSVSPMIR